MSILLRQSLTMMKRKGDNGSPCLRPFVALIFLLGQGWPVIIIEKLEEDIQPLIHLHHVSLNPLTLRVRWRKSQSILSKAFSISILTTIPCLFFLKYYAIISMAIKEASRICRSSMKVDWNRVTVRGKTLLSLFDRTLPMI